MNQEREEKLQKTLKSLERAYAYYNKHNKPKGIKRMTADRLEVQKEEAQQNLQYYSNTALILILQKLEDTLKTHSDNSKASAKSQRLLTAAIIFLALVSLITSFFNI